MKRVENLQESRTAIRAMFATVVQEMFNKSIKELNAIQLHAAIHKVAESVTITYVPKESTTDEALLNAFKAEVTTICKMSTELKLVPSQIWTGLAPELREKSAPKAKATPVKADPKVKAPVKPEAKKEEPQPEFKPESQPEIKPEPDTFTLSGPAPTSKKVFKGRDIQYPGLEGKQIDINKMEVNGKVYVAVLESARKKFAEANSGMKWFEWVEATYFTGKVEGGQKSSAKPTPVTPAKGKAKDKAPDQVAKGTAKDKAPIVPVDPFDPKDKSNENTPEFFERKLKGCKTEDELKLLIEFIDSKANRSLVFTHKDSGHDGVVTGTKVNTATQRPVIWVTLSDGTRTKAITEIFNRYYSLKNDPKGYATIHAGITKEEKK